MTSVIQIMTAVDSREAADRLAEKLLEARLAACVQIIGPASSRYWWNGGIKRADEWLCLFKSRRELYPAAERAILEAHPYENPEVLAIPVSDGSQKYIDWIVGETSD